MAMCVDCRLERVTKASWPCRGAPLRDGGYTTEGWQLTCAHVCCVMLCWLLVQVVRSTARLRRRAVAARVHRPRHWQRQTGLRVAGDGHAASAAPRSKSE
jgi:hypothetical protein